MAGPTGAQSTQQPPASSYLGWASLNVRAHTCITATASAAEFRVSAVCVNTEKRELMAQNAQRCNYGCVCVCVCAFASGLM
jgi:hypothetical protein